jgi:AraC-like DNA-binding protein
MLFIPYQLLIVVLLYYYGQKLLYPEKKLSRRHKLLLLPFAIGFVLITIAKIAYANGLKGDTWQFAYFSLPMLTEFFAIFYTLVLVIALLRQTRRVQKNNVAFSTAKIRPQLQWFKILLGCFLALTFIWLIVSVLYFRFRILHLWYIVWILISILIYWMGHMGIYKFGVQEERKKIRHYSMEHASVHVYEKQKNEHVAAFEAHVVRQKRFLDPELTLDKISEEINVSKSHLSRMINTELQTSFPDYINTLRVEEAKAYMSQPEFANYTLVAVGLEAGFASKTTFNNAFKKITGLTPSEYKSAQKTGAVMQKTVA